MTPSLDEIIRFLDNTLKTKEITDYKNALNGLQVQNNSKVGKVAVAVDASEYAIREAAARGADLLIVHHGLFWPGLSPITGSLYRKLSLCLENNLAVYSSHLPLDIHPEYGNNAVMAKECGLRVTSMDGLRMENSSVGLLAEFDGTLRELTARIHRSTGSEVKAYLHSSPEETPGPILLCSGGAGDQLPEAISRGIKTFISGEGSHWTIPMSAEEGINTIYAGHYATETFGVKSLALLLSSEFGLSAEFIEDAPSPLIYC